MTPIRCNKHELRPGELGDSPRYLQALREYQSCWRCRVLAVRAWVVWRLRGGGLN